MGEQIEYILNESTDREENFEVRKKLLTITLTVLMSFSLVACGNDKTAEDAISVEEKTEEKDAAKEETEAAVEEETATEETAIKEANTAEYQVTQMNSAFYGGIAWATVADTTAADGTGAKTVLINKNLQIVYELPEEMIIGDIFAGKAAVINADQTTNPGFIVVGADGTVLYECSDTLAGDSYDSYNVNFINDGCTIYERKESGLTANAAYACVLNEKFEKVGEIEIPDYWYYSVEDKRFYSYMSDGVYACTRGNVPDYTENTIAFILNTKENNTVVINSVDIYGYCDMDRCAGIQILYYGHDNHGWATIDPKDIDYSKVTDTETLINLVAVNGRMYPLDYDDGLNHGIGNDYVGTTFAFRHELIEFTVQEGGIVGIEGVALPDLGANIQGFRLSNDGKYVALQLKGADGNEYYTVITVDGQKLYEPVTSEQLSGYHHNITWCGNWDVCDGYIMDITGNGITPDGTVFQLGDGTDLSGIGENSFAPIRDNGSSKDYIVVSDGYIVCQSQLYQTDGTQVTTVTAAK